MSNVKENFLRYVQIETTSSETSGTCPSTPNQWVLAKCWWTSCTQWASKTPA